MDFQTPYPKFLYCTARPKESLFCGALPLKAGVVISAVLDTIIGLLGVAELVLTLSNIEGESMHYVIMTCVSDILSISALPLSLLCLSAFSTQSYRRIHFYSCFKQVELFTLAIYTIAFYRVSCIEGDLGCDIVSMLVIWICRTAFNLYFTYVVWSADIRLGCNETVLVLYGRDVIRLMQDQVVVASPRGNAMSDIDKSIPIGIPINPK